MALELQELLVPVCIKCGEQRMQHWRRRSYRLSIIRLAAIRYPGRKLPD